MTLDQFFELSEGDIVRFKNHVVGGYNYYKVDSITRVSNELGIPIPMFRVWLVPLDESGNLATPTFHREIVAGDIERMELVTI